MQVTPSREIWLHRPKRRFAALAELGADLLVAAHAEGADRALGQLLELLLERVEHRRDRRIGVLRRRPLFVDLLMAFAALRSGGIEGEGFLVDRGDGRFFALLGFCGCGECRHLPMAVRFRVREISSARRRYRLSWPVPSSVRASIWAVLEGLGLPRFSGAGDSILAEEGCVTQYGACESAGKYRTAHYPLPG